MLGSVAVSSPGRALAALVVTLAVILSRLPVMGLLPGVWLAAPFAAFFAWRRLPIFSAH